MLIKIILFLVIVLFLAVAIEVTTSHYEETGELVPCIGEDKLCKEKDWTGGWVTKFNHWGVDKLKKWNK